MPLQGLTVAMSLGGIQYLFQTTLQPSIVSVLQKMTMPAPSIPLPSPLLFNPGQGAADAADAAEPGWPPMHFPTYWAVNSTVNLTNGSLANFRPTFQEITQGQDGEFTVKMSAENLVVNYDWNESYDEQKCPWDATRVGNYCTDQGQKNPSFKYMLGIGTWSIVIVFKFQYSATSWQLSLVSTNSTTDNLSPNIPSNSVVNQTGQDLCFKPQILTNTENALKNIDFSGAVKGALEQVFKTIPQSGQLADNIAFDFSMGPSGLAFPNNSGLATGVAGTATWKGTVYPGTNPPQLKLPEVPTTRHLAYYISDYSINALFWAFFSAGLLKAVATDANTGGNSSLLNTNTFISSPAQVIATTYPDAPMTANINAQTAPSVVIKQVYEPTKEALNNIRPPLPPTILAKLQNITANIYVSEPEFFKALVNVLGEADADTYKTVIESAALSVAAVVTFSNQMIMNVLWQGNTIPVLTYNVSETDSLNAFVLAHSGTTQTLQFVPSLIPTLTTATFVSSPFPDINPGDFSWIYNIALQKVFAAAATAVGKGGVALPRIQGFNFLFDNAAIDLQQGYASVLTDVMHTNDNGALYFQSKRLLQPDESNVASATRKNWSEMPPERPLPPLPPEWAFLNQSS